MGFLQIIFGARHYERKTMDTTVFAVLHEQASDSIQAQNAYYDYLSEHGLTASGCYSMTDDEARGKMNSIMELPASNAEKDALLSALDVEIQNHSERGIASPVIFEVLAAQYVLIKNGGA